MCHSSIVNIVKDHVCQPHNTMHNLQNHLPNLSAGVHREEFSDSMRGPSQGMHVVTSRSLLAMPGRMRRARKRSSLFGAVAANSYVKAQHVLLLSIESTLSHQRHWNASVLYTEAAQWPL